MAGSRPTERAASPLARDLRCSSLARRALERRRTTRRAPATTRGDHMDYADGLVPGLAPAARDRRVLHAARLLLRSPASPTGSPSRPASASRTAPAQAAERRSSCSARCCSSRQIARELWPGRPRIELGAAAFVAFLPVTVEDRRRCSTRSRCRSSSRTLALWLCVRTFADRRYVVGARRRARRGAARARVGALDGRRGRDRAARRPALARARDRASCSRPRSRALVHPPAQRVRRLARVPAGHDRAGAPRERRA